MSCRSKNGGSKDDGSVEEAARGHPRRGRSSDYDDDNNNNNNCPQQQDAAPVAHQQRSVASHVRERQRAVAEREAARLARPEARPLATLAHADRKKSAVTSTPFGVVPKSTSNNPAANSGGWCGPFSVARQMIAEREAAARKRLEEEEQKGEEHHPLDEAMEQLEQERKRKQHPSILWKSSVTTNEKEKEEATPAKKKVKKMPSLYATRQRRATMSGQKGVDSLFNLCVGFLVDNFEHVESVGFVDSTIRKKLAHELAGRCMLNDAALEALTVSGMESLELPDASGISAQAMLTCLEKLAAFGLRYLALDQAGRCFGPKAAEILIKKVNGDVNADQLQALAIGGAYCLKDENAARLVSALEATLQSIEFKACPLIGERFCKSLLDSKNLVLRELSLEDLTLSDAAWTALEQVASAGESFWADDLESLRLRRMQGLTDERVQVLLQRPKALRALDLGLNMELSDAVLAAIRASPCCNVLSELRLTGLKLLTASGLEALFTVVPNMGPPPRLMLLDVGQCNHEAVSDQVVELVARAATHTLTAALGAKSPAAASSYSSAPSFGIVHLNIQGSALVTDTALEVLVATGCGQTLQELNVSYCTKLTDQGLGYFVDNAGSTQLKTLSIWGLAQVSELFLDGHKRANDPTLQIVGAWMKKNSMFAIR